MHASPAPWLSMFVVLATSLGCGKPDASAGARLLRISMIPTTGADKMLRASEPLKAYLEQATGARVELTIPLNYAAVVEAFGAGPGVAAEAFPG